MIRVFTLDILISCIIAAFVIGGLVGFTIMCCLVVAKDSDRHIEEKNDESKV